MQVYAAIKFAYFYKRLRKTLLHRVTHINGTVGSENGTTKPALDEAVGDHKCEHLMPEMNKSVVPKAAPSLS